MSLSTFTTQRQLMRKNMPDAALDNPYMKQQKVILYLMPIFFAISGINFPIGVLLYWLTTNVWSMGQQFYVIRRMPAPGSAAERAYEERQRKRGKTIKKLHIPGLGNTTTDQPDVQDALPEAPKSGQRQQPKGKKRAKRGPTTGPGGPEDGAGGAEGSDGAGAGSGARRGDAAGRAGGADVVEGVGVWWRIGCWRFRWVRWVRRGGLDATERPTPATQTAEAEAQHPPLEAAAEPGQAPGESARYPAARGWHAHPGPGLSRFLPTGYAREDELVPAPPARCAIPLEPWTPRTSDTAGPRPARADRSGVAR